MTDGTPTYMGPARGIAGYYPAWLDNLADDVAVEGSLLLLSRLLGEKFAGTPLDEYFLAGES